MTAVIRAAARLAKRGNMKRAATKKLKRMSGEAKLRSSLRKIKKRWNIPDRIRDRVETVFNDLFGKSPRGTTWSALAERYPERFQDYINQAEDDGAFEDE